MAVGGEPYSVAARRVGAAGPAVAADEIIARANRTLATPVARIELRRETEWSERPARPRPGPAGRLVRRAGRAASERIAPA
jgi:hypothetical protein